MNREEAARYFARQRDTLILGLADSRNETRQAHDAYNAAIDALISPQWVKTSDRLPDDNKPVLITYVGYTDNLPHNDAIAVYAHEMADNYAGAWYWQDSDGVDDNPVSVSITHWMPIPPLPEVEG